MPDHNVLQDPDLMQERALVVLTEAWRLLPDLKHDLQLTGIALEDLDTKHGSWSPEAHILRFSTRLFTGDNDAQLM